jgi:hypothetical protein
MKHDYDEELTDGEREAAELIISLKLFLMASQFIPRDLERSRRIIRALESLGIDRASLAYAELNRLRRVWKKRQHARR